MIQPQRQRCSTLPAATSTLRELLREEWSGSYVNADEIGKALQRERSITLADLALTDRRAALAQRLHDFLQASSLWRRAGRVDCVGQLRLDGTKLTLGGVEVNSYARPCWRT